MAAVTHQAPQSAAAWQLNKWIVAALLAGFVTLFVDIRWEHIDPVREHWTAWIPIVYSGAMAVIGAVSLWAWGRGGRQVLLAGFALSFVVGALGYWFHNHGHLVSGAVEVLSAWTQSAHHGHGPPPIAPLAFIGLGFLGLIACTEK